MLEMVVYEAHEVCTCKKNGWFDKHVNS